MAMKAAMKMAMKTRMKCVMKSPMKNVAMKKMASKTTKKRKAKSSTDDDDEDGDDNEDDEDDEEPDEEEDDDDKDGEGTEPQTDGHKAIVAWAKATQRGEKTVKPHNSVQWVADKLKSLDRRDGGNLHMQRYNECKGTKEKSQIALKLALDMRGYDAEMKAYHNEWRGNVAETENAEGWQAWWEIAAHLHLPPGLSDDEKKEYVEEMCTEKDLTQCAFCRTRKPLY